MKQIMMNCKLFYVLISMLLGIGCINSGKAQSTNTQILLDNKVINPILPTPEMASLGKYGSIPIEYNTGAMTFSIPLYSIKKDNIEIPLGVSFASQGLKPEHIGNTLGVNWVLSGLANISRNVNGLPDETSGGYLNNQISENYIDGVSHLFNYSEGQNMLMNVFNKSEDLNPDAFTISMPGFHNQFFLNKNKQLEFSLKTDYKISFSGSFASFIVTDPWGNKYFFEAVETSSLRSQVYFEKAPIVYYATTGWKISKIETVNGREFFFMYDDYHYSYSTAAQDVITIPNDPYSAQLANSASYLIGINANCGCQEEVSYVLGTNLYGHSSKILKRILTDSESIDFVYSPLDNSLNNFKISLKEINIFNVVSGELHERILFDYSHFSGDKRLKLTSVNFLGKNISINQSTRSYQFTYYEEYSMPSVDSRAIDENGYYNGAGNWHLVYHSNPISGFNSYADRIIRLEYMQTGMLKQITYPTGGKSEFIYELNSINGSPSNYFPGLRVKQIKTSTIGSPNNVTEYKYKNQPNINFNTEYPKNIQPKYLPALVNDFDCSKYVLMSDNHDYENPFYLRTPRYIFYDEVEVWQLNSNGHNLKTVKKYVQFPTMLGDFQSRITDELFYKTTSNEVLVKHLSYEYTFKGQSEYVNSVPLYGLKPSIPVFLFSLYSYYTGSVISLGCGEVFCTGLAKGQWRYQSVIREVKQIIKDYDDNGNILISTIDKTYHPNYENLASSISINSKQQQTQIVYSYPYDFINVPVFQDMVSKNIIGTAIEVKSTNLATGVISDWNKSNFRYNNVSQIVLDKIERFNYLKSSFETEVSFDIYDAKAKPLQVTKLREGAKAFLWDHNKNLPIAQAENASFSSIAYTSFEADSKGNWDFVGSLNLNEGITGSKSYYLNTGNIYRSGLNPSLNYIITYWLKNGSGSVNIGGIPKISKNGWTMFETTITGQTTLTISGTAIIDELRLYPKGAQMTTYTYSPLLGITSQCDLNNQIIYYEYDLMNRLKFIKDIDRNILKSFDYTYQQIQY